MLLDKERFYERDDSTVILPLVAGRETTKRKMIVLLMIPKPLIVHSFVRPQRPTGLLYNSKIRSTAHLSRFIVLRLARLVDYRNQGT